MKKVHKLNVMIILVVMIASFYLLYQNAHRPTLNSNGVKWDGVKQNSSLKEVPINYIMIPGFTELHFSANRKVQFVNFYNPESNSCSMSMSIILPDGEEIWSCENIQPGYGIYEIELAKPLDRKLYEGCHYKVRCFKNDGTELNGGNIKFNLYIE